MTKTLRLSALLACTLFASPLLAKENPKMAACNKEATGKKGDERKKFMSECLSKKDEPKLTPQQQKMKDCNAKAAGKKGDERKKFMSECLKG
jgi:psiF repeat